MIKGWNGRSSCAEELESRRLLPSPWTGLNCRSRIGGILRDRCGGSLRTETGERHNAILEKTHADRIRVPINNLGIFVHHIAQ